MSEIVFPDQLSVPSPSGATLTLYRCGHTAARRGVLLVHHGLAEHAARYARFAHELAASGIAVYAHDHRGHGRTSAPDAPLRRFARRDGAAKVLADCRAVHEFGRSEHPGLPVALLGHSMGGLIAMNYAQSFGTELAGLAVWNCNPQAGAAERVAQVALRIEKALKGSDVPSRLLSRATFEAWGKSVEPRSTMFDWLSHDTHAVDAYVADPLCGWTASISMMEDVLSLVLRASKNLHRLPSELPVHLLGGTADPVTAGAEAMRVLEKRLRAAGSKHVDLTVIEGARHEALQETERLRVQATASLARFLERVLPAASS